MFKRDAILMVFFDVPVENKEQQRQYRKLMKFLVKDGYIRIQKSVYAKRITNISTANLDVERFKQVGLEEGNISMLIMNYKYFKNMIPIVGKGCDLSFFEEKVLFL